MSCRNEILKYQTYFLQCLDFFSKPYLLLFLVCCFACQERSPSHKSFAYHEQSPFNKHGKFDFGQNPAGKNFPKYLYEYCDTVTRDFFYPETNDIIIQLTRDENLSEKYLGKSVIRVTFASAFSYVNFVSVSLVNENGKTYLIEKESYNFDILDTIFHDNFIHQLEYDSVKKHFKQKAYSLTNDSELVYQNESEIDPLIYSQKREINPLEWNKAISQLDSAVFALPPSTPYTGLDGHEITIETHFPDGYYVAKKWSSRNDKFGILAYSILWLGERSKVEGHLKSEITEHYIMH
jgi:hypothetical protein